MLIERILTIYAVQAVLAIIICILFRYYFKAYKRNFLRWWAFSWLFYALAYIGTFLLMLTDGVIGQVASSIVLICAYLQLLFLVLGVINITSYSGQQFDLKKIRMWVGLITIFGLISSLIFIGEGGSTHRYIVRIGVKCTIVGLVFLWSAYEVHKSKYFHQGVGKIALVVAFCVYALQQFWHAAIVYLNTSGISIDFPVATFGLIDLFALALIAIGMVSWLLENEHKLLLRTNRELDSFLYSISHDLRSPIASILGLTYLAKEDSKEEIAVNYFNMIEERMKKLDNTIGDILMMSKGANAALQMKAVPIQDLLNKIISGVEFHDTARKIRFVREINIRELRSDALQLENILVNLIGNAVKYHDDRKEDRYVKVSISENTRYYFIIIEDNGQGIPKAYQSKIFDMFYRANEDSEGTGLGLYITKEAVLKLGGKISLYSEERVGTTFTILIPKPGKSTGRDSK